jgi:putative hydrolase of the HAD superfamily
MLQAVTFDVTNTLLHCPRLGEIYSEVLARHGIAVAPGEARRLIRRVWQEMACAAEPGRDRFTSHPEGERGWWRRFLTRFCEHLGSAPPSPFAAAELFHRFAQGASWEVYPEVPAVLDRLRARGLRLGVASNWDHRLPALLGDLGLRRRFDAVVYSSAAGVEKPDPRIFERVRGALGLGAAPPSAVLHVGDHQLEDFEGALAAGLRALLVRRDPARHPTARAAAAAAGALADLTRLPEIVAAESTALAEPGLPAL